MNRKQMTLFALLGILLLCVSYAYLAMPRQQKAPPRTVVKRPDTVEHVGTASATEGFSQRVMLDNLTTEPLDFPGAERDIFNYKTRSRPAPVVKAPVVSPTETVTEVPAIIAPPIEEMQRALGKFTFLGFLDKGGEKTVFLSSGGALFTVKRGEHFGPNREFLVAGLDDKMLTVQRNGGGSKMQVPLVENQQLQPVISSPARIEGRPDVSASQPAIRRPAVRRSGPIMRTGGEEPLLEQGQDMPPEEVQEETSSEGAEAVEGETNVKSE